MVKSTGVREHKQLWQSVPTDKIRGQNEQDKMNGYLGSKGTKFLGAKNPRQQGQVFRQKGTTQNTKANPNADVRKAPKKPMTPK